MKRHLGGLLRRYVVGAVATAALLAGLPTPAAASYVISKSPVEISWDASEDGAVTSESVFGVPVVVPGDSAHRSLTVRNAGPSDATLTARIVNVELAGSVTGVSFYDDLQIHWANGSATMRELQHNGETAILQNTLAQGAHTEISLEYHFPLDALSANQANTASHRASFDVELELSGDLPNDGDAPDTTLPAAHDTEAGATAEAEVGTPTASDVVADSETNAGTTAPFGLNLPTGESGTVEASASEESLLDTGPLELIGGVRNWPITITVLFIGFAWAVVRTLRSRKRTSDY